MLQLLAVGRRQAGWLAAGILVSLASLAAGIALMVASSHALAGRSAQEVAGGVALMLGAPVIVRLLGVSRTVLRYAERLATHAATFRLLAALRVWLVRRLIAGSAGGLGFRRSGDVASRLVADVEALDGAYPRVVVPAFGAILLLPVLVAGVAAEDAEAALAVAVLFGLAAFVLPVMGGRAAFSAGQRLVQAASSLRIALLDGIVGLKEVRVFGAERGMVSAAESHEAGLLEAQRAIAGSAAVMDAASLLCGQAALLIVLAASGTPAGALTAVFLTAAAFEAVSSLPRAGVLMGHAAAAAGRILEAADPHEQPDPPAPATLPHDTTLRFEGVTAGWARDRPAVLNDLSLRVAPGSRVALLGPSGSGKSTLAALALRVLAPWAGRITLGGTDIQLLTALDLRSRVALLSQATHVFDDTIRGNLLLGRADAADAELWAALDQAALGDVVRALPDGLETWVGEGGAKLSGGQARRLALARALLSRAPILILDEPATGLDADTERAFLASVFGAAQGRTIILIAHRLTGVERLDRIWRLSGGRAVAATA